MNKETNMNPTIEKLRVRQILDTLASLTSDSIDRIIAAAQVELYGRADEEQAQQDYDDLLARQYEADRVDDFLFREGIK